MKKTTRRGMSAGKAQLMYEICDDLQVVMNETGMKPISAEFVFENRHGEPLKFSFRLRKNINPKQRRSVH